VLLLGLTSKAAAATRRRRRSSSNFRLWCVLQESWVSPGGMSDRQLPVWRQWRSRGAHDTGKKEWDRAEGLKM